jgi:precorrin-2 dehydrogenase / sirohydrochlorin ferrochelatase
MPANHDFSPILPGGSLMLAWQVKGRNVLIIGGGNVAAGRIIKVLEANAIVTLVSPRRGLTPEVAHRVNSGQITHYKDREFDESDLDGVDMCLTAIDSSEASTKIWKLCKARRIPVNVADVPSECDFYFGSEHRDGPLQIMISTNGAAPKLANLIRRSIAENLPKNAGEGCLNVGKLRRKLRSVAPGTAEGPQRMKWYGLWFTGLMTRMIDICQKYSLDELILLDDEDMDRLLFHYRDGAVPPYWKIHNKGVPYEFDGSFGWHC